MQSGGNPNEEDEDLEARLTRSGPVLPEGCSLVSKKSKYTRAGHELCRIAAYRGRWNGKEFPVIRTEYSKLRCSFGCGALIRTFCRCDKNLMLCSNCYGEHIASLNGEQKNI